MISGFVIGVFLLGGFFGFLVGMTCFMTPNPITHWLQGIADIDLQRRKKLAAWSEELNE